MKRKIVIVDDDPMSVEFMRLFIESESDTVFAACLYSEAISLIDQHHPDIVITDIELPDGSGCDIASHAKQFGNIFVIAVSGFSKDQLASRDIDISQFDILLTKPIAIDNLKKSLPSVL